MKEILEKVIAGNDLNFNEAYEMMLKIMGGEVNNAQIAAYLTALKAKGEHHEEIAGSVAAMRKMSKKITPGPAEPVIDVCGTGGDSSGTFNISTAAAFVIAGAGIKVAKHGNRSVSSKSGSADVLKELGVNISLPPDKSEQALQQTGITFLFAPDYHPAMKHVAPVRQELGMKTIFNILGPLTNPAGVKRQIIGTFNNRVAEIMARALGQLEMEKVCFLCTENRYDEITLTAAVQVYEYSAQETKNYRINFADYGYPVYTIEDLAGDSASHNAQLIRTLFDNPVRDARFYVTAANAGMGLFSAGYSDSLPECLKAAEESLLSGRAMHKLTELIEFGES